MEARTGTGRSPTSSSTRPREMMGRPSYEDIEPKSTEWREEKTAHVLSVHLPGFVKEQIRVTYDESSRSFNVQGDRPLGNNRFVRLNKDFTVPNNSKMKDMEGRFQDEVLTITVPKEYVSPFFFPKEPPTSPQSSPGNVLSVTHEPPAISEPPKVPPSMPPPEIFSTAKQPGRQSDHEKLAYPKGEPSGKPLDPNRGKETLEKETEKRLIANVGVAALVLVAFGAYVGYNFACPRSAKD